MLARCPSCHNTFSTDRAGRQECPVCGKPLLVPGPEADTAGGPLGPAPGGEGGSQPAGTPWERRSELGILHAWAKTVGRALFEPSRLFDEARIDRSGAHVGFAVLTSAASAIVNQVLGRVLVSEAQMRRLVESSGTLPPGFRRLLYAMRPGTSVFLAILIAMPLLMLAGLYLNALVTHGIGLALGQVKRGFPATLAACAYGLAPSVLMVLPGCGSIIAVVWIVVLTGIGLRRLHGISAGGAAASVLVPYLVLCCLSCGLVAVVASFLPNAMVP